MEGDILRRISNWLLNINIAAILVAVSLSYPVLAEEFSVGYKADYDLPTGMVVSLLSDEEGAVEPANQDNIDDLLGVVVGGGTSLFQISSQESNVQVVTDGKTEVLVTDVNGVIEAGDHITVSSINGIGVKADDEDRKIVGKAIEDFKRPDTRTVETDSGDMRDIAVARIPVMTQIGGNPDLATRDSFLPDFVQNSANALAGEPVEPARIVLALLIITGGVVGSMVLLYGAVSSTIISIGRNPLSDKSVYGGLARIVLIAVVIILLTSGVGYLIIMG